MNKPLLILALLALAAPPPLPSPGVCSAGSVDGGTLPEALRAARQARTPVRVYVHAAGCGPCRRLERETFADPAVRARLGRFACAQLAFDDRDRQHRVGAYKLSEAEWSARLGAEATPTLVLLDPDGAVLGRSVGFLPPDGLLPILDAALAGSASL